MPTGDVETYYANNSWANRIEGDGTTGSQYDTKEQAAEAGRELAKELGVEHIIKKQDGTIGERSSYGKDPRNIPG